MKRRMLLLGLNCLKLDVISNERILRSRGCEEGLGPRDPQENGSGVKTKVEQETEIRVSRLSEDM